MRLNPGEEMTIDAPGLRMIVKAGDDEFSTAVFVWPEDAHEIQHFDMESEYEPGTRWLRIDVAPRRDD